jgi:GMP synthase-like glutamine amidotransferase
MRIHYFQHVPFESLGSIRRWIGSRKHNVSATRWYKDGRLPPVEEIDWLIVMGGPMGVYDEDKFPWLKVEKDFILQAIQRERRVLGICLGAQLIASVLGAKVGRNPYKEIGWHKVQLTEEGKTSKIFGNFPEQFVAFHWHGDAYELPAGARRLAKSEACREQAFVYNDRVLGLQFHLDIQLRNVEQLIHHCREDLLEGAYTQKPAQMLARQDQLRSIQKKMFAVLNRLEVA